MIDGPVGAPAWSDFFRPPTRAQADVESHLEQAPNTPDQPQLPGLPLPTTPIEDDFRHSHWASRRRRIYDAFDRLNLPARRRWAFANCGANAYVEVHQGTGQIRCRCVKCHDRFCEPCQRERRTVLAYALAERVGRSKTLHVVLTLKSRDGDPGPAIDALYKAAAKLRGHKWWKAHVTGGCYSLEITRNPDTGQYHPHLHLLVHADYLMQAKLSALWFWATGDSYVVHVSLVHKTDPAVREVTKYLSKPIHRSMDFEPDSLDAMIEALRGRRTFQTFGTWLKDKLVKDRDQAHDGQWKIWGTFTCLARTAAAGDTWAQHALAYLASLRPGRLHVTPPPKPTPLEEQPAAPTHAPPVK